MRQPPSPPPPSMGPGAAAAAPRAPASRSRAPGAGLGPGGARRSPLPARDAAAAARAAMIAAAWRGRAGAGGDNKTHFLVRGPSCAHPHAPTGTERAPSPSTGPAGAEPGVTPYGLGLLPLCDFMVKVLSSGLNETFFLSNPDMGKYTTG